MSMEATRKPDARDGLILAIATVAGAVLGSLTLTPSGRPLTPILDHGMELTRAFLVPWTPAIAALGTRGARRPWRRRLRRPGMAACSIGAMVLAVVFLGIGLESMLGPWKGSSVSQPIGESLRYGFFRADYSAYAIAGAWLVMALGGRWRPEKSAIDRLGRAVGAGWIALLVAGFADSFLD